MKKKFTPAFIMISILIFASFFLTWIKIIQFSIKISGAALPMELPRLISAYQLQPTIYGIPIAPIGYLLYLIPLLTMINVVTRIIGKNKWFFQFDYLVGFIAAAITYFITTTIAPPDSVIIAKGLYLTGILSVIGICLQIIQFLFFKKKSIA